MYEASFYPKCVVVDDFNNDNKLDLITANSYSESMSILLGNGDGTFQRPMSYTVDSGLIFVAAADFNNDTNLDLTAVGWGSTVYIILGNGDGTFQE
ncbi:unnamed protein product, partial [Rotaria magnacalcarata]